MKAVVERLIERHGTYGEDWMGFELKRSNPLTYHHIKKDCDKGKKTMENGALLSRKGHRFLNCLEIAYPDLYEEWNALFVEINRTKAPLTETHKQKIKTLRRKGELIEETFMRRK